MSTAHKPLNVKAYDTKSVVVSEEQKYWEQLSKPAYVFKQSFASFNIDASPINDEMAIASCGASVLGYKASTGTTFMKFSRIKSTAYGAVYREDGQLILTGTQDSYVHLFNAKSPFSTMRVFKGHEGPVKRVRFVPHAVCSTQIVTFSDDKTIGLWDIPNEKRLLSLTGHTDSVRAGCMNPTDPHMIISGSNDKTVRLWDSRTGTTVVNLDHGSLHVNDTVCHPQGQLLAAAAGCEIKIWDIGMRRQIAKVCKHHREILCLRYNGKHTRLMSGGLDKHIKVYDAAYNVVHSFDCGASVLSFALTKDDKAMFVATNASSKGWLSIFKKQEIEKPEEYKPKTSFKSLPKSNPNLHIVRKDRTKEVMQECDKYLKNFKFTEYLQKALKRSNPCEVVALLSELVRVNKLHVAIAGNDTVLLNALFGFLTRQLSHPTYATVLYKVVDAIIDVYVDDVRPKSWIDTKLTRLLDRQAVTPTSLTSDLIAEGLKLKWTTNSNT